MPAYDYTCDACEHRFEMVQKFSEDAIKTCPECGAERARRLISVPSVVFKGSGWYVNDTRPLKQPKNGGTTSKSDDSDKSTNTADSGSDSDGSQKTSDEKSTSKTTEKPAAPAASSDT